MFQGLEYTFAEPLFSLPYFPMSMKNHSLNSGKMGAVFFKGMYRSWPWSYLPSFILLPNPIRPGEYLGTCISEDNVELERITLIVQNSQEIGREKPHIFFCFTLFPFLFSPDILQGQKGHSFVDFPCIILFLVLTTGKP